MNNYIKYVFLALIMVLMFSADIGDDPPKEKKKKKDTVVVDTAIIQMEQLILQEETKIRLSKWDSLMLKQDSIKELIKKK